MIYTNYTNIDACFLRPYQPGDRLVRGWSGEIPDSIDCKHAAEAVFELHNRDDRPDGQMCPSMSVGDVVVVGEVALSVDQRDWKQVNIDPADVITGRTWYEVVAEVYR
jgi:hypothetical protein